MKKKENLCDVCGNPLTQLFYSLVCDWCDGLIEFDKEEDTQPGIGPSQNYDWTIDFKIIDTD